MKKISRNLKREINKTAHAAGVAHAKKVKAELMARASDCLNNGESSNVEAFSDLATHVLCPRANAGKVIIQK